MSEYLEQEVGSVKYKRSEMRSAYCPELQIFVLNTPKLIRFSTRRKLENQKMQILHGTFSWCGLPAYKISFFNEFVHFFFIIRKNKTIKYLYSKFYFCCALIIISTFK